MSSGTTAWSSSGLSAAHRSATARAYASTRPGGYAEGGVGNGDDDAAAPAAAAPAAASSGSASLFVAARMMAGIRHPRVMYLRVAGDASAGPARRSAVAAINVSSSNRRRSGRPTAPTLPEGASGNSGGAASASNTRKPRSAGVRTVASSGGACRGAYPSTGYRAGASPKLSATRSSMDSDTAGKYTKALAAAAPSAARSASHQRRTLSKATPSGTPFRW